MLVESGYALCVALKVFRECHFFLGMIWRSVV